MLRFYPAVIDKSDDSDFGISFPDFPGCVTADPDLQTALHQAAEALSLHVDGMLEDGEAIPLPSTPDFEGDDKWVMIPLVIGTSSPMSPVLSAGHKTGIHRVWRKHVYPSRLEAVAAAWEQKFITDELSSLSGKMLGKVYAPGESLEPPQHLTEWLERHTRSDEDTYLLGALTNTETAKRFSPSSIKAKKTTQKPKPVTK